MSTATAFIGNGNMSGAEDIAYDEAVKCIQKSEQSFGGQISYHRRSQKMTREDLAKAVVQATRQEDSVDSDRIIDWEQGKKIPDRDQFKALMKILIESKRSLAPGKLQEMCEEFTLAYDRSKNALEQLQGISLKAIDSKNALDIENVRGSFGRLIIRYAHGIELEDLAEDVNSYTRINLELHESRLLQENPVGFIGAVERGDLAVSKEFVLALAAALGNHKKQPISEEAKEALFAAYKEIAPQPQVARIRSRPVNGTTKERRIHASEATPLTEKAVKLREDLRELFMTSEGEKRDAIVPVTEISHYLRVVKEHHHGAVSVIYTLLNQAVPNEQQLRKCMAQTAQDILADYLKTQEDSDDKIKKMGCIFKELRTEMRMGERRSPYNAPRHELSR